MQRKQPKTRKLSKKRARRLSLVAELSAHMQLSVPKLINTICTGGSGQVSTVTEAAPAGALPSGILVGWYLVWTLVPAVILWMRYRRLAL